MAGENKVSDTPLETTASYRYNQQGKRDLRLDWLRGYALFAMAINHFGVESNYQIITGGAEFLINAAELFFFISGFTLGFISINRPLEVTIKRIVKRTWIIYLFALAMTFGYGLLEAEEFILDSNQGELLITIVNVFMMKEAANGADILIAYVIFMAFTPLAIWALYSRRTKMLVTVIVVLYFLSQISLEATSLPFISFRHVIANSPLFYGGLVFGWHRTQLTTWWHTLKWNRLIDQLTVLFGLLLLFTYIFDYFDIDGLQTFFGDFGIREYRMPVQNLLVVFLYLRLLWLLVTFVWKPMKQGLGWLVLPLGQASLYTFTLHYLAIGLTFIFPWTEPILELENPWLNMIVDTTMVAILFGLVMGRKRLRSWLSHKEGRLQRFDDRAILYITVFFLAIWLLLLVFVVEPGGWEEVSFFQTGESIEDFEFDDFDDFDEE